jgi:phytoene dehydrogenase-like protein
MNIWEISQLFLKIWGFHMQKSIIIIGAGMGGLASGIFGQLNGYRTQIFEMHTIPGGSAQAGKEKDTPLTYGFTTFSAAVRGPK